MTEEELIELGLLDPDAPNATERLTLLRFALEHGATVQEMREAIEEDRLHAIPALASIAGGGERFTLEEAIRRAGVDPDLAHRIWRALGLPDPEPDTLACTERDVVMLANLSANREMVGDDAVLLIARSAGAAMARLADTEIAMVRASVEAPLRSVQDDNVEVAHVLLAAADSMLPGMLPVLDAAHRHHLITTGRRYALWGTRPTESSTTDAVVGFVDIVGSTSLSQQLDATDLDRLLRRFEDRALDATRRPLARLVKLIGDEAMFVAGTVDEAVAIVEYIAADTDLPQLRAGIAAGTLMVREGDVYGPVVNLAARLAALATSGQTLVDGCAAERFGVDRVTSLGPQTVAGIDDAIDVYAVAD